MSDKPITDPLLGTTSELIVEDELQGNIELRDLMLDDVKVMSKVVKSKVLAAMLRMHKYFEEECGDLEVSLKTEDEIKANTEPWYVILDEASEPDQRLVRYHYRANWETFHGVEVLILNGKDVVYVGNCGRAGSVKDVVDDKEDEYNFANVD